MARDSGERRKREVLAGSILLAIAATASADPRGDYLLHCAGCHLADGRGNPPSVPSLAGPLGVIVSSREGRDYLARVPGAAQAPISDDALAAVLNWVLLQFNAAKLPRDFKPLRASEIAHSRARVLTDPLKLRRKLWPESARDRQQRQCRDAGQKCAEPPEEAAAGCRASEEAAAGLGADVHPAPERVYQPGVHVHGAYLTRQRCRAW